MSTAETDPSRKHAYTESGIPQLPEPTYAERVRTLVSLSTIGTLSTVSRKRAGYPFGSLMPYAIDDAGRPIFLISNMAMHTQNIQAEPRASLFVCQGGDGDPLGTARATLVGDVLPIPDEEVGEARERYLSRYENSRSWVDFKDFGFYRLQPLDLYYVGGFGVMGWVTAEEYQSAKIDPLADAAPKILEHMNSDHVPAMILLAQSSFRPERHRGRNDSGRPAWISPSAEDWRWDEGDTHQLSAGSPNFGRGTESARGDGSSG
jgi:putative heme iron utilization protein